MCHYICQHWNAGEKRWIMTDAQIDDVQRKYFRIGFNAYDMPEGEFITGGRAWRMCREENIDPGKFGLAAEWGIGTVRCCLILDMLALNKIELMPGDSWNHMPENAKHGFSTDTEASLYDEFASAIFSDEPVFSWVRMLYENTKDLHPKADWMP